MRRVVVAVVLLGLIVASAPVRKPERAPEYGRPDSCRGEVRPVFETGNPPVWVGIFNRNLEDRLETWAYTPGRETALCNRVVIPHYERKTQFQYEARLELQRIGASSNDFRSQNVGLVFFTESDAKVQGCVAAQKIAVAIILESGIRLVEPEEGHNHTAMAVIYKEIRCGR